MSARSDQWLVFLISFTVSLGIFLYGFVEEWW
jgi:hypothetical protein